MAPIKKGKKKKDEKKSGPKGKKERAKAKLDNRWGEYDIAASKNSEKETSPFTSSTGTTDDPKESKKKTRIVAVRKKKKVETKTRHRRNEGVEGFYQRLQQGKHAHQQQTREQQQQQRKAPFTSAVSNSDSSSSSDDDEVDDENQSETSSMNGDNDNNTAMGDLLSMIRKKNNAKQLEQTDSCSSDDDDEGSSSEDDESSDEDDDEDEDEVMVDANGDHHSNTIVIAVDGNDNNNNNTIKKVTKTGVDFFRQRFSRPSLTKSELKMLSLSQQKKKTTKMEKISVPFSSTKQRGGGGDVELHYTPSPLSVTSSSTTITAAINDNNDNNNNSSNMCDDILTLAGREDTTTNTPEAWQAMAMAVYHSDNTRDVLRNNWSGINETKKKKKKKTSSTVQVLSELQAPVYSCLSRYTDSFVTTTSNSGSSSSSKSSSKQQQEMHQLYLFHVLNHVLTSRSRIGRNNRYLKAQELSEKKNKEQDAKDEEKKEAKARKQRKEQLDNNNDDEEDDEDEEEDDDDDVDEGNKMDEDNDNEEEESKIDEDKDDDDDDDDHESEGVQQQQEVVEEVQKVQEEQRDVRDQGFTRPTVLVLLPTRGTCYTFIKELYQLTGAAQMTPEQEQRFEDDYGKDLEDDIDDEEDEGAGGKGGGSSSMKKKAADKERRRKAILQNKGKEWNDYFGDTANQDDDFKIGISLIPKAAATATSTEQPKVSNVSVKLYSDFYKSDIIVASPLGLKMMLKPDTGDDGEDDNNHADVDVNEHGGGRHDKSSFDYLSSIEICLLQHSEMILMQNWDHVNDILQLLNQEPKHNNSTDFSRVRNYLLEDDVNNGTGTNGEGKSTNSVLDLGGSYGQQLSQQRQGQYWRQLIISSKFMDPTLLSSFKRFSKSLSGAVKVRRKIREGVLSNVFVPMKQVFQQIPVKSFHYQSKARVDYFMQHVLPTIQRNEQTHTCLYIPSYFDFCALRNTLLKNELVNLFVSVTEYARATEISRGRARFLQGRKPLLLYTGRAHFFHRHAIKGIRNLIFFGLPEQAEFYSDYVNLITTSSSSSSSIGDQQMMLETNNEGSSINNSNTKETSCIALFTKYEVHALERIVGSTNCNKMISSTNSTFMFYS